MAARALVVARDAGAAAALSPVARALIREGRLGVSIVAFGQAAGVFRERGLPVLSFSESPTQEQIESLLAREGARIVLTGTSMQAAKDAAFWEAARHVGVPSIALWTTGATTRSVHVGGSLRRCSGHNRRDGRRRRCGTGGEGLSNRPPARHRPAALR